MVEGSVVEGSVVEDWGGFINFKHLSTAVMNITTKANGYIHIFAFSYNILKIKFGEIKLEYNY